MGRSKSSFERMISLLLALMLILSNIPAGVLAETVEDPRPVPLYLQLADRDLSGKTSFITQNRS